MQLIAPPETYPQFTDFAELPDTQRIRLAANNPIINTDTYNRTMDYLRGPDGWREEETYTLQMRRSPYDYLVVAGIEDAVDQVTARPISQEQLDFAEAFYSERGIPMFNMVMWQAVIDEHDGHLPVDIHGAPDGTVVLPGEPVLRVRGPGELIAHFEPAFHRPFYSTLVATKAHEITRLLEDPQRFIEVGKRGTPDEFTHQMAVKAMQIGGDITFTSNDAAVAAFDDVQPVGTIGHRYVQRFETVEAAFRHAIKNLDTVSLLVDLVESYQGLKLALQLKEEYRATGKKIGVRLDSGTINDIKEQLLFYLRECEAREFTDPALDKVVVEGIESLEEMRDIEASLSAAQKQRVVYGAGGLLVAQKTTRSDASTGFKLSEYQDQSGQMVPTMKFSSSPGKYSLPGRPTIVVTKNERIIAQEDEIKDGEDLLKPLYSPGQGKVRSAIQAARARRTQSFDKARPMIEAGQKAILSPETKRKMGKVMCRYGLTNNDGTV